MLHFRRFAILAALVTLVGCGGDTATEPAAPVAPMTSPAPEPGADYATPTEDMSGVAP